MTESQRKQHNEECVYWVNDKGQLHRVDGPAVEWADCYKEWWVDGKRHRIDGPAIEYKDGRTEWYQSGLKHRADGPAIDYRPTDRRILEYWLGGEKLSKKRVMGAKN